MDNTHMRILPTQFLKQYGRNTAIKIADELNKIIQKCIEDKPLISEQELQALIADMNNAPELYLENSTLIDLKIINFTERPTPLKSHPVTEKGNRIT